MIPTPDASHYLVPVCYLKNSPSKMPRGEIDIAPAWG